MVYANWTLAIKVRISISIAALILYNVLFNVYIAGMKGGLMSVQSYKLFYNYLTGGMILFVLLDWKSGFQNYTHQQINLACILCVIVHYILIILHWHLDTDTVFNFSVFNTSVLASLVMIILSSMRLWKR